MTPFFLTLSWRLTFQERQFQLKQTNKCGSHKFCMHIWLVFFHFLNLCLLSVNMYPEKRHYGTFLPTESGKIPIQTPTSATFADSMSSCALQCLKDVLLCVSLAYNSITGVCSFYRDFFFVTLTASPNTTLYVLQPYWVLDC